MRKAISGLVLAGSFLPAFAGQTTHADEFYKGRKIDIIIGYSAGGTYDAIGRLLSRHMPKYIAGSPTIIPQNLPGSGSIKAILTLYTVAPKDGTTLAMITRGYPIEPLFYPEQAKYDPSRFNPIGSTSKEVSVGVVWHTKPFRNLADLQERELVVGATGSTDDTGRFPMILKNLTGAKIKVVQGYPGGNNVTQAMEAGEVDGRFGWSWGSVKSRSREWLADKKIRILIQMAHEKAKDLPDVPLIMDLARTDIDRQALELAFAPQTIAWPLVAPPDVPKDRVTLLRRAFDQTMKDPQFIAEAEKLAIEIDPVTGEEMQNVVVRITSLPRSAVDRALALTTIK
jgi:tripartite-type tricarboxylate transporter receptor subunit TctC